MIAVLGTSGAVSSLGQFLHSVFLRILADPSDGAMSSALEDDEQTGAGSIIGILCFILALQSGLCGLSVEKRLTRLYRNLWLMFSGMLILNSTCGFGLVGTGIPQISGHSQRSNVKLMLHWLYRVVIEVLSCPKGFIIGFS